MTWQNLPVAELPDMYDLFTFSRVAKVCDNGQTILKTLIW
jgi:hypothetical protein